MKKGNKKKHITKEERFCIEKLCKKGKTVRYIADVLGRGKTTVSDEIKDNGGKENYNAKKAHHRAYLKQYFKKKQCTAVVTKPHIQTFIERKLMLHWSPEAIAGHLKRHNPSDYVSGKAIRRFIKRRPGLERNLFFKRNHKKSGPKKKKDIFLSDPGRKSIDDRPETKGIYGHWEMDFIVSKHNSTVLLVMTENLSKYTLIDILPNRNNDLVNQAVASMLKPYRVLTLTTDNDIAFIKWRELEKKLNAPVYFCHPYSSWEKGLVENTNRWIRAYIPKKTDLSRVSPYTIHQTLSWLNDIPRESVDWMTTRECMLQYENQFHQLPSNWNLVTNGSVRIWG